MNREKRFENRIYSIAIPDRDYGQGEREVQEGDGPRGGIAWFIPNSPPLPNDDYNYRRYRRGLERQSEIEMMLIDHQWQARRGQGRGRVAPQARGNVQSHDRVGVRIRIRNLNPPGAVPANGKIRFPKWSLFQVWNNLAYVTCSVPYRVVWDDQKGQYVIKYSQVQQVLCGIENILSAVEMISWWRTLINIFSNGKPPLVYVQFGSLVVAVTKRICYMRTTLFGMGDLLQVHTYAINTTGYQIKMGKVRNSHDHHHFCWKLGVLMWIFDILMWICGYAREIFFWGTKDDCPDDIFSSVRMLPRKEIIYGCMGILTYVSATLAQIHTTLMIMSSCVSLLSASHSLTNLDNISGLPRGLEVGDDNGGIQMSLTARYEFLEKFSGKISSFIGLVFMLSLAMMGLSLPNTLDTIFNDYENSGLVTILPIVILIISCLAACVAAMQIDALEERMTETDNIDQLPNDIRRLIIYLHRLFRRSPGIGYRGLFVMNFVYLVTYCGAVAGLVAFTFENKET